MSARGKLQERTWRRSDGTAATIDDISVAVVPVKAYKDEYAEWKAKIRERIEKGESNAVEVRSLKEEHCIIGPSILQFGNLAIYDGYNFITGLVFQTV